MRIFGWEIVRTGRVEEIEKRLDKIEDTLKDILSRINMNEYDIKRIAERTNTTEENVKNIMISMQDKLSIIDNYNEAVDLILDHIDKKNPYMNIQKPIYHGPVIEEETEEDKYDKRIEELRLISREYTHKSNAPSMEQLIWVCDIEFHLNVPKFKGLTQKEVQMFIGKYKEENKQWWKNNSNKGVAYNYGN